MPTPDCPKCESSNIVTRTDVFGCRNFVCRNCHHKWPVPKPKGSGQIAGPRYHRTFQPRANPDHKPQI